MTHVSSVEPEQGHNLSTNRACKTISPAAGLVAPTIFHEEWWLQAASGGTWREAVVETGGAVIGRLPYMTERKALGQTVVVMPTLTHVLGPSLAPDIAATGNARSLRSFTTTTALIKQLPEASLTWFELHRGVTDTLAFEAAGFATGVNFTMDIAPDSSDALWRRMRDKTRNVVRRAQDQLMVSRHMPLAEFLDFYEENLRQRGTRNAFNRDRCEAVIGACLQRGVGRILATFNAQNAPVAAIFTAWDERSEYFRMSTRRPDAANGAISLLIWSALRHAAAMGRNFDVDRVNSRTNLTLLTGFGGTLRPRYFVSRSSMAFDFARRVKGLITRRPPPTALN
jgi:hypothetical protein